MEGTPWQWLTEGHSAQAWPGFILFFLTFTFQVI